ncbi:helix-turn-helix domain-containing protein [Nonomuraea rhizosphaerae]|uniref:helix-turn-helix domain-containing protein n=1 Tax=Nonomuraea rhizosphaerae TaxID=2665663 RepID=UPI001C5EF67C|nr:helix-turn-helix transcriptional regulator [Nonomuraea rhizosphaerae]
MNDNLRHAIAHVGLTAVDIAARLDVDPKTVDRWLRGRTPYPRHRWALADLLDVDEADLWPDAATRPHRTASTELKALYPHRWAVPRTAWQRLFGSAAHEIGILVYSGLFLAEDTGVLRILRAKARAGLQVRILLGDPDSPHVATRGADEAIGEDIMTARTRNALALFRRALPLVAWRPNRERFGRGSSHAAAL